jgi:hypothetical protein
MTMVVTGEALQQGWRIAYMPLRHVMRPYVYSWDRAANLQRRVGVRRRHNG